MAETTLPASTQNTLSGLFAGRNKFLIGGGILLAAVAYLIVSNLLFRQEYFITVDQLTDPANVEKYVGRSIRVSGVVLGPEDMIEYDGKTLTFVIANIPDKLDEVQSEGGLAEVLHRAAENPNSSKITVVVRNQAKPDLLQPEAQAILTGTLGEDGVFYANELLLKCPTRYEEAVPQQAAG